MDPSNPFETFERTAFRLEALPQYIVENEKEAFAHFLETGEIMLKDTDWQDLVAKNIAAGKKMERLRLFSKDLTDYERYEIEAYPGPKAGEVIRTALRKEYELEYRYDFWFFDEVWIAQVNYETDGTFVNFDVRVATEEEKQMFNDWYDVFKSATPLVQPIS